ncbi:TetR/AcrR family transcriptional regulator [Actinomadura sp. K4S16]|uniref:TetR/AcrR family transcriptional regulator n=1 Tax=Actinomadura sp. K4S16 TaxID=1316147 RepID=UPI0011EFC514|nr:TetR/AcrR family transcriptional regulator [Actinomadura sp. K4S16]
MRADAKRNRERIVTCALDLFVERGPGVSMEEIARAADLGVGTLYRHFPDRRALVEEIASSALRRLGSEIRRLREQEIPRWDALTELVAFCAGQPFALVKSVADGDAPKERLALQDEVDGLFLEFVKEVQEAGAMRDDISPAEAVEILSTAVCRPGAQPGDAVTRVMLDGLRAKPSAS